MGAGQYDVIVVGARVAGAATAMLLARQGLRVLAVDRVSFPSDTVSSHQLQVPGVALLRRWGVLDRLVAAGTPPTRRVRLDFGTGLVLDGQFPAYEGVDTLYSPRRTLLDAILVDAARRAGAEVRENFRVEEVTRSGGRVVGVRGRSRGGRAVTETASLVIGADGRRSLVAEAVGARRYRERPVRSFASYSYWSGVPAPHGELYQRPGRAVAVFPTNGDLTMVYSSAPIAEFASARGDLENHYLRTLDLCGDLGDRVGSGIRVERLRTTPDQPNTFRHSHGPGWALVGDAGVVMDSISAHGMTNALRDAGYLSAAVVAGLGGSRPLAATLKEHQHRRDLAIRPIYDFTLDLAAFPAPTLAQRHFLAAVASDQEATDRLLGAFAGVVPADEYFTPVAMLRTLGSRGARKLATAKLSQLFTSVRHPAAGPDEAAEVPHPRIVRS
jgi:2-polyprenyl-6-methoxyphenol hydroxylase-like FAD-dependent oxidoreductase